MGGHVSEYPQGPGWWMASDGKYYPPESAPGMSAQPAPRQKKKPRIFLWFFLAVQLLFVIWIISGISSANPTNDAEALGTGIGVALVIGLWAAVDVILGIGYGVYRLARRP